MNQRLGDRVRNATDRSLLSRLLAAAALAAALLALAPLVAADVQLQLDRSRVTEGETVTLTFVTDDARQSLEADFSVLKRTSKSWTGARRRSCRS